MSTSALIQELQRVFELEAQNELVFIQQKTARIYQSVLSLFLKQDIGNLASLVSDLESETDKMLLATLARLRLQILKKQLNLQTLQTAKELILKERNWAGEIHFIIGLAYDVVGNHLLSKHHFVIARKFLQEINCLRKANRAHLFALQCEGKMNPEKNLMHEYHSLYRQAMARDDEQTAGLALVNISLEYRKMGALHAALTFINSAVDYLNGLELQKAADLRTQIISAMKLEYSPRSAALTLV